MWSVVICAFTFLVQWWKTNKKIYFDCLNKIQFQAHLSNVYILDTDIIPFREMTTNESSLTWQERMFSVSLKGATG